MVSEHDVLMMVIPVFSSVLAFTGLGIVKELKKISNTTQKLSVTMAVIAERVEHHERRINSLEAER